MRSTIKALTGAITGWGRIALLAALFIAPSSAMAFDTGDDKTIVKVVPKQAAAEEPPGFSVNYRIILPYTAGVAGQKGGFDGVCVKLVGILGNALNDGGPHFANIQGCTGYKLWGIHATATAALGVQAHKPGNGLGVFLAGTGLTHKGPWDHTSIGVTYDVHVRIYGDSPKSSPGDETYRGITGSLTFPGEWLFLSGKFGLHFTREYLDGPDHPFRQGPGLTWGNEDLQVGVFDFNWGRDERGKGPYDAVMLRLIVPMAATPTEPEAQPEGEWIDTPEVAPNPD